MSKLEPNNRTNQPKLPLLDFFERHYKPYRLPGRTASAALDTRAHIEAFTHFLNRPATLCDLNEATFSTFTEAMVVAGINSRAIGCRRDALTACWRYANRKGFVDTWPPGDVAPRCHTVLDRGGPLEINPKVSELPNWLRRLAVPVTLLDFGTRALAVVRLRWSESERSTHDLFQGILACLTKWQDKASANAKGGAE